MFKSYLTAILLILVGGANVAHATVKLAGAGFSGGASKTQITIKSDDFPTTIVLNGLTYKISAVSSNSYIKLRAEKGTASLVLSNPVNTSGAGAIPISKLISAFGKDDFYVADISITVYYQNSTSKNMPIPKKYTWTNTNSGLANTSVDKMDDVNVCIQYLHLFYVDYK